MVRTASQAVVTVPTPPPPQSASHDQVYVDAVELQSAVDAVFAQSSAQAHKAALLLPDAKPSLASTHQQHGNAAGHPESTMISLDQLDPALLELVQSAATADRTSSDVLDPALFGLEAVVNDVRNGKLRADGPQAAPSDQPEPAADPPPGAQAAINPDGLVVSGQTEGDAESHEIHIDDDGIDPALREIVNSLTNAQQGHQSSESGQGTDSAIQLGEGEAIDATLTSALEDLQNGHFGALFPGHFPHSDNFLLPEQHASSSSTPLTHPPPESPAAEVDPALASAQPDASGGAPIKRGRGRPKGSKNKIPRTPQPRKPKPKKPPGKIGRPRKVRTAEEQAEYDLRMEEKRLGIQRKHGRPRKYPGFLVRDMRLKKNRAVYEAVVLRGGVGLPAGVNGGDQDDGSDPGHGTAEQDDGPSGHDVDMGDGGTVAADYGDHPYADDGEGVLESLVGQQHPREMTEHYDWHDDPHNLLGTVGDNMDLDRPGGMQDHEQEGEPSARAMGKSAEDMREVFGLEPGLVD